MSGLYDELLKRGFVYQCTDEKSVSDALDGPPLHFYVGYDPTADSLHVGSLIPILGMKHLQKAGHVPIVLVGGGTGLVGDPSGKTEARKLLVEDSVHSNCAALLQQLSRFITIDGVSGKSVNNAEWLREVKYIDFLRDIGRHFSVNKMLTAESYKLRLETGLTFLEFNYMLLQAYDFLVLNRNYGCRLQMGGQDQWGNIVAGVDLVRRVAANEVFGLTFPLLTDSKGAKIGKSVKGAIWLSADKTSPFDFYQFWRNIDDEDVGRFLKLFTFLPVDECERLAGLQPPLLNRAKEILAFEVTALVHGLGVANETYRAALTQFPSADPSCSIATTSGITGVSAAMCDALPVLLVDRSEVSSGLKVVDLLLRGGLVTSRGEGRRLVRQGGVRLNEDLVSDEMAEVEARLVESGLVIKAGKKRMVRIEVTN